MQHGAPERPLDRLEDAVARVRRDVEGTAGVDMTFHTYPHRASARFWPFIVAARGEDVPRRWIHGALRSLAGAGASAHVEPEDFTTHLVASTVAEAVQLTRYARGLDPTWPPCPVHRGRHPLRPDDYAPGGTCWVCPAGGEDPPGGWPLVGDLTAAMELWGFATEHASVNFVDRTG